MKKILILIGMLVLVGCSTPAPKIIYKQVDVPVYYVPSPPKVERPTLYINSLTTSEENNIGYLSQGYLITAVQLKEYACELETIVNKYDQLSKESNPKTNSVKLTQSDISTCTSVTLPQSVNYLEINNKIPDLVYKYFTK